MWATRSTEPTTFIDLLLHQKMMMVMTEGLSASIANRHQSHGT
jgi:hypothetical protein